MPKPKLEQMVTGPALDILKIQKRIQPGDWVLLGNVHVAFDFRGREVRTTLNGRIRRLIEPKRPGDFKYNVSGHGHARAWWVQEPEIKGWYPGGVDG